MVTAMNKPEVMPGSGPHPDAFFDQISNYSLDPHFVRPIAASGTTLLAMHAAHALAHNEISIESMASVAAAEVNLGAERPRGFRAPTTTNEVLAADSAAWPLTRPMLPALSSGVVSLVLASDARARRSRQIHARIRGCAMSGTPYTWNPEWLIDATAATRRAASRAYRRAGISSPASEIEVAEITALTPALHAPTVNALQLDSLDEKQVNPSGGVRSNFPGLANGLLRVIETVETLKNGEGSGIGVAHAVDYLLGTVSSNASVLVVEA
jgi:hypothetical protein